MNKTPKVEPPKEDWRSKVFIDQADMFNNPKLDIEHKLALLVNLVAPNPGTVNEAKAQLKYLRACAQAIKLQQEALLSKLLAELPAKRKETNQEGILFNIALDQVKTTINKLREEL